VPDRGHDLEVAGMTPMLDASADPWRMSATELAEAIRSKQVEPGSD
jgi:hypothetical protein